jgi:hypothetical protein
LLRTDALALTASSFESGCLPDLVNALVDQLPLRFRAQLARALSAALKSARH